MDIEVNLGKFTFSLQVTPETSGSDAPIWMHLRLGDWIMTGGELISPSKAREFASALLSIANEAEGKDEGGMSEADYIASDHAFDAAREDRIFGR